MKPLHLLVLLILGIVWGSTFLFVKVAIKETTPFVLVEVRTLFALGTLTLILLHQRRTIPLSRKLWFKVSGLAVVNACLPFLFISWGQPHIPSGTGSVLNATMPLFVALISALLLTDEHLNGTKVVGLILGISGVIVFTSGQIFNVREAHALGELSIICGAIAWAVAAVYGRVIMREGDPLVTAWLHFFLAIIFLLPPTLLINAPPDFNMSAKAWLCIFALGGVGSGGGFVLYLWLIKNIGPVRASLNAYIMPISGLFLGWLILGENLGINSFVGCAIIIAGVYLVLSGRVPFSLPRTLPRRLPAPIGTATPEPQD
ncbi:MAG TPA: DMT family transporter [Dehalococcoidia bacterium]|nr:DMT family transporter [Dehalococcoidia bacterium]